MLDVGRRGVNLGERREGGGKWVRNSTSWRQSKSWQKYRHTRRDVSTALVGLQKGERWKCKRGGVRKIITQMNLLG